MNISPLDERYASKIKDVIQHFTNYNFTKYKLCIECEYSKFFILLVDKSNTAFNETDFDRIYENYNEDAYNQINLIEKDTNHDIQALIEYIKIQTSISLKRWIHFGLTSQDINSTAMILTYRDFNDNILSEDINKLIQLLTNLAIDNEDTIMLSFTHGQPATPSTFGKQMLVFIDKINYVSFDLFNSYEYRTKIGGSNGDLSGLKYCFPQHNWEALISEFLYDTFSLRKNKNTTQIDDYINYFKLFQIYERFCYLLINLCQDMWLYIHKNYLKLIVINNEVGSSAMPHKVNPIHFENAEGNLKISASLFHTIGSSITLNRMQRDLTDSTMLRNVGVACGHLILAIRNICTGLSRISVNVEEINNDITKNSSVFMEFYQLKLREWNIQDGYIICKNFSRGNNNITLESFISYLESLNIILNAEQKTQLNMDIDNVIKSI